MKINKTVEIEFDPTPEQMAKEFLAMNGRVSAQKWKNSLQDRWGF